MMNTIGPDTRGTIDRLIERGAVGVRGNYLAANHLRELHWGTNDPEAAPPLDRPVIMGHQPREEPFDTGDVIAIDTGAGTLDGGRLTALLLPERAFVTVGG